MTIQQTAHEPAEGEHSALKPLTFQLGKELRSLADNVTNALAVNSRVYTNVSNSLSNLTDRHVVTAREMWCKLRELAKKVDFVTDELCRQHKETQNEIQKLRALIVCMDHNDRIH